MDEKKSFGFGDLLSFDKIIAPAIIKIVYYIGLVGIVITTLTMIVSSFNFGGAGIWGVVMALFFLVFGTLMWRVLMEIYIVVFGIYERLGEIRDRGKMP